LKTIIEAVSSGDKVTLVGFGSLNCGAQPVEGRNPKDENGHSGNEGSSICRKAV